MTHSPTETIVTQPRNETRRQAENSIRALQRFGQSVRLDDLRRSLFTGGEFRRLIVEDGLRGATSNPSIFQKAITGSADYLDALKDIERKRDARHSSWPSTRSSPLSMRHVQSADRRSEVSFHE